MTTELLDIDAMATPNAAAGCPRHVSRAACVRNPGRPDLLAKQGRLLRLGELDQVAVGVPVAG